jgi:predicted site-specific integrase-resolvase
LEAGVNSLDMINQLTFVEETAFSFLCGADRILKYYFEKLQLAFKTRLPRNSIVNGEETTDEFVEELIGAVQKASTASVAKQ